MEVGKMINISVVLAALKECSRSGNLQRGKQVHAEAVECGHDSSIYVGTALINMYAKCGSMVDARQAFNNLKHPNLVAWNALILGYADNGQGLTALNLFTRMKSEPDSITFMAALKACTSLAWPECRDRGKGIHNITLEKGCDLDIYVQSALMNMYTKCGNIVEARQVFSSMSQPDLVAWNTLILGYAENGQGLTSLDMFRRMRCGGPAPSSLTFMAALKASLRVGSGWVERGKQIHNLTVENGCYSDIYVQSALIDMYAKCGSMMDASQVFEMIKHPNVVTWNALIVGCVENGEGLTALNLFSKMKSQGHIPNSITFMAALKACGLVGGLEFGRKIHLEIHQCFHGNLEIVLLSCLVDFYSKCGSLVEAKKVFDSNPEARDLIIWNALLTGFSTRGDYQTVFELFEKMQDAGFQPSCVTFLSILNCCNHAGLVDKGRICFDTMSTKHGIIPSVEHYNCMVDIFVRSNMFHDAMALLDRMTCIPNDVTWKTILGSCLKWKNMEMGRLAFQSLITFNDSDSSAYVLMGRIYENRGMLQEQEMVLGLNSNFKVD